MAETSRTVDENSKNIDSLDEDIEALKRRNIDQTISEAYTRRENMRILNMKEEPDKNTEQVVRNIFVTKLHIPKEYVDSIWSERVHKLPTKNQAINHNPIQGPTTRI